jgi:SAM-dependent methyltransferase
VLAAVCAVWAGWAGGGKVAAEAVAEHADERSKAWRALWVLLPATGVVLLLATTNRIGQEVAEAPFLWVPPLALYLLTFVVAFDAPRWYRRRTWMALFPLSVAGVVAVMVYADTAPGPVQLAAYCGALFVGCMVCHGELARLKPSPGARAATAYYACISAGGAAGGIFVGLAAPVMFTTFVEYPLGMVVCGLLACVIVFCDPASGLFRGRPGGVWFGIVVLGMVLGQLVFTVQMPTAGEVIAARRNFYGAISVVVEDGGAKGNKRLMRHGRITHGMQLEKEPRTPVAYYGKGSGLARVMEDFRADRPRRIGVIGLGAGTLAAFGRGGDSLVFYEINADVVALAREQFTFLKDCPAGVEVVVGDGRLSIEREAPRGFDVLVLDAFSGDAVPVHLLTREAFAVYRRHLAPGGVIVVNVTNRHVRLKGVVNAAAAGLGMTARLVEDDRADDGVYFGSDWIVIADEGAPVTSIGNSIPERVIWTDDRASLWGVLKWRRRG